MINDQFYRRRYVISGIAVGVVLVYIIRLFYLQVIDQSTKDQADNNALVKQTILSYWSSITLSTRSP